MAAESDLQSRIIADLKKTGWFVVKVKLCSINGHPDIVAYKMSEALYTIVVMIEVKAPGKHAEPLQKYVHEQIRQHGPTVYTVNSWEQYKQLEL